MSEQDKPQNGPKPENSEEQAKPAAKHDEAAEAQGRVQAGAEAGSTSGAKAAAGPGEAAEGKPAVAAKAEGRPAARAKAEGGARAGAKAASVKNEAAPTPAEPPARSGSQVSRRTLLRSLMWGSVGIFFAEAALAGGAMFWPRKLSGFGAKIVAGTLEDFPPNTVTVVREGKFYISHVAGTDPDTGEDYGTSGLIALYWRCTHLGCTVPWAPPDDPDPFRHFHCPCHGSTFDRVGKNTGGPAPRPLDYMAIEIDDQGRVVVDTGNITERGEYSPDQVTKI